MKFLSYFLGGEPRIGLAKSDRLVDLTAATGFHELGEALRLLGAEALQAAAASATASHAWPADLVWRPAVADPRRILCVGLNYEEHRLEAGRSRTPHPTVFMRLPSSQAGHLQPLLLPPELPEGLDFEGEIAIVIGRGGRRIPAARGLSYVFGYAPYNDASARAFQAHSTQWTAGKNFPSTGAFGPFLVSADEVGSAPIGLTTRLNGQVVQQADTTMLIFDIGELIAYASTFTELEPGDVIVTGTPGGVGFKRVPPLLMKPGDVVEVEVERVGLLRNVIVAEQTEGG
jgi:2-keto-4-pentenoate hydratase/2-oxohepta-3-ene-1,7-dioic acid hydratase in catechol pathway